MLVAALTLFSGFGLGTLLLPTFSIFFPIEVGVAATAIVHLANNIFKFFLVGRMADFKVTLKFSLPAAVFAALGTSVVSAMIVDISRIIVYGAAMFGQYFAQLNDEGTIKLVVAACFAACIGSTLGARSLKRRPWVRSKRMLELSCSSSP